MLHTDGGDWRGGHRELSMVNDPLPGTTESSQRPCKLSSQLFFCGWENEVQRGKILFLGHTGSEAGSGVRYVCTLPPGPTPHPPHSLMLRAWRGGGAERPSLRWGCRWNTARHCGFSTITTACVYPALSLPLAHSALRSIPTGAYYYLHLTDERWKLSEVN